VGRRPLRPVRPACLAFRALTGQVPYPRPETAAVIYAHLAADPPRPSLHRADLPPAVDAAVARATAKQPERRFATCTDFIAALRAAVQPRPTPGPDDRYPPRCRYRSQTSPPRTPPHRTRPPTGRPPRSPPGTPRPPARRAPGLRRAAASDGTSDRAPCRQPRRRPRPDGSAGRAQRRRPVDHGHLDGEGRRRSRVQGHPARRRRQAARRRAHPRGLPGRRGGRARLPRPRLRGPRRVGPKAAAPVRSAPADPGGIPAVRNLTVSPGGALVFDWPDGVTEAMVVVRGDRPPEAPDDPAATAWRSPTCATSSTAASSCPSRWRLPCHVAVASCRRKGGTLVVAPGFGASARAAVGH
jgi:hypothetical protein